MTTTQDALALAEELEKLLAVSSPAPWRVVETGYRLWTVMGRPRVCEGNEWHGSFRDEEDAELAAKARNLVPYVVASLRSLAEISTMPCISELLGEYRDDCGCASCTAKPALALACPLEEGK